MNITQLKLVATTRINNETEKQLKLLKRNEASLAKIISDAKKFTNADSGNIYIDELISNLKTLRNSAARINDIINYLTTS